MRDKVKRAMAENFNDTWSKAFDRMRVQVISWLKQWLLSAITNLACYTANVFSKKQVEYCRDQTRSTERI
jgi:hypothetical protein